MAEEKTGTASDPLFDLLEPSSLRGSVSDRAVAFARVLVELDSMTTDELVYFMDRPEKWDREYEAWLRLGRPSSDEPAWRSFEEVVEVLRA